MEQQLGARYQCELYFDRRVLVETTDVCVVQHQFDFELCVARHERFGVGLVFASEQERRAHDTRQMMDLETGNLDEDQTTQSYRCTAKHKQ